MSTDSKAAALQRGRRNRDPNRQGPPSATPLPPPADVEQQPRPGAGRASAGQGRRGHLRKLSLELPPEEHDRLKVWIITAFGGGTAAAQVLRALLAEAYADPALTERVRRRLERPRDGAIPQ